MKKNSLKFKIQITNNSSNCSVLQSGRPICILIENRDFLSFIDFHKGPLLLDESLSGDHYFRNSLGRCLPKRLRLTSTSSLQLGCSDTRPSIVRTGGKSIERQDQSSCESTAPPKSPYSLTKSPRRE